MTGNTNQIVQILRQCLDEAASVEIEGLGVFRRHAGGYEFFPSGGPRIFIAYVQEDVHQAERLYSAFQARGFDPWLDRKRLLPGQNWPRAIQQAIEVSDFFVACLSRPGPPEEGAVSGRASLRPGLRPPRAARSDLPHPGALGGVSRPGLHQPRDSVRGPVSGLGRRTAAGDRCVEIAKQSQILVTAYQSIIYGPVPPVLYPVPTSGTSHKPPGRPPHP